MTSPLGRALEDLVAQVPPHVVPAELASNAWAAGRARRRRRLAGSAVVVVVVVVLGLALPSLAAPLWSLPPAAGARSDQGVDGHPHRIGHQWFIGDLPDKPGPIAGAILLGGDERWDGDPSAWYAFTDRGYRWRLDATALHHPAVSRDGRRIGYLAGEGSPYVIHDLVTGAKTQFTNVSIQTGATEFTVPTLGPSFWSPDGTRVAIPAGPSEPTGSAPDGVLILGLDGSATFVPGPVASPAGWIGNDALLWFSYDGSNNASVAVTELDGSVIRTLALRPAAPLQGQLLLPAVSSPDGSEVVVLERTADEAGYSFVHRFSLIGGAEHTEPVVVFDLGQACRPLWVGKDPAVPVRAPDAGSSTALVADAEARQVVGVDPTLGSQCIVWAADALAGEARINPLELFGWWLGPEIPAVFALAALAVLIAWWRRWRLRRRWRTLAAETSPRRRP